MVGRRSDIPYCRQQLGKSSQCLPKNGGITVVPNKKEKLISTQPVTGWRIYMDYLKLNASVEKYHFPLTFMDQMLDRLTGRRCYCFLDGYFVYNQICIAPKDQDKTIFTSPYGTFAFKRMLFGLCNASATFQRCMLFIFTNIVEDSMEVFMDDFLVVDDTLINVYVT